MDDNIDDDGILTQSSQNIEPKTDGKSLLESWLNKNLKITMSDGRTLIGVFICTDKDCNVILGSCLEYLKSPDGCEEEEEPRILGLAMIPGHHIVTIALDQSIQ